MRKWGAGVLALSVALAASPARAQDAETLRRELDQMKKQFEDMKRDYQKAIDQMSERLNRLEATPPQSAPAGPVGAQVPPAPSGPASAQAPAAPAAPSSSMPSAADLLRPREPYALSGAGGRGQLLFDVGIAGDFIGDFADKSSTQYQPLATFPGQAQRFFPREVEVAFYGAVDPYARAYVII